GTSALGAHIRVDEGVGPPREAEVVAVVRGVKHTALDDAPTPTLYAPLHQLSPNTSGFVANNFNLVLRVNGSMAPLGGAVRRAVPASTDRTMDHLLEATVAPRRFTRLVLEIFAAVALLLMSIGLYGVLGYSIARRTREIAIRRALGATNLGVLALVTRQGL